MPRKKKSKVEDPELSRKEEPEEVEPEEVEEFDYSRFRLVEGVSEEPPDPLEAELPVHWSPKQRLNWLNALRQRAEHLTRR